MTEIQHLCLNCKALLQGKFCSACGQKQIEPYERTLKYFITQFLGSAFFLENNFLKNLWLLVSKPGLIARDYVDGKQKRYMPPFSVFLLINLFYFIFSPLSDFNLSLREQITLQPYSSIAKEMVDRKIKKSEITFEAYELKYWDWSSTLAKTLIILNVPITAFLLTIWFRRRPLFFADHFIYALYFYSFIFLFTLLYYGLLPENLLTGFEWLTYSIFPLIIILYTYLSIRRFYLPTSKLDPILNTLAMIAIVIITHFSYRAILFLTTYAVT